MKKLKILIAEDEDILMSLFSEIVEEFCEELFTAIDGEEAVRICQNHPEIDLVLMDIRMPKLDGLEATRKIREFNKDVLIFAQTAFAFPEDKNEAIAAGCDEYLAKPVDEELLKSLIEKHLGGHSSN